MSLEFRIYVASFLSLVLFGCLAWVAKIDGVRAAKVREKQKLEVEYISEAPPSAGVQARVTKPDGRKLFLDFCSGCHEVNPYAAPSGMNVAGVGSRMSKEVLETLLLAPPPPMQPWVGNKEELDALTEYLTSLTTGRSYLPSDIIKAQPDTGLSQLQGTLGYDVYVAWCSVCHQINPNAMGGGLNLAGVGARLDEPTIRLLLANPHAGMPDWRGGKDELNGVVSFLMGLNKAAGVMPGYRPGAATAGAASGVAIFQKYNCSLCHNFEPGKPLSLVGVGSRRDPDSIREMVKSMHSWGGDAAELDAIVAYLSSLQVDAQGKPIIGTPGAEIPAGSASGSGYFKAHCAGCHQVSGAGGGMNLAGVGERLNAGQIKKKIKSPPGGMPGWSGTDAELDAVVGYLSGLKAGASTETEKPAGEEAKSGKEVFSKFGCSGCHNFNEGAAMSLAGVGSRYDKGSLKAKIKAMPGWAGTDAELGLITGYLFGMKSKAPEVKPEPKPEPTPGPAPAPEKPAKGDASAGKSVFESNCSMCHNIESGSMGLADIGAKLGEDGLRKRVVQPPMPDWSGTVQEFENLIAYLLTL